MLAKGTGGRQLATRISLSFCANCARSAEVVPATPRAEVRLGAPAVPPPGMPAHAGVVTVGAGAGAACVGAGAGAAGAGAAGAGAGPEGFGCVVLVLPEAELVELGRGVAVAVDPVELSLEGDALGVGSAAPSGVASLSAGSTDAASTEDDDEVARWRSSTYAPGSTADSSTIVMAETPSETVRALRTSETSTLPPTIGAMRMALVASAEPTRSDRSIRFPPKPAKRFDQPPGCSTRPPGR